MPVPFPWSRIAINGLMWFTMGVWASLMLDEWRETPLWRLALMGAAAVLVLTAYTWLLVAGIRDWAGAYALGRTSDQMSKESQESLEALAG
ncbi:MAG: hypothetical protein ABJD07_02795 [Gemmatimonadaceae bacterium]